WRRRYRSRRDQPPGARPAARRAPSLLSLDQDAGELRRAHGARAGARCPPAVANLEFHRAGHEIDHIGAVIVAKLEARGVRAVNPSMGFPMEMYHTPSYAPWIVSHKPIAVEASLGHMGIHRNLIHPRFGNFVLLGTVLTELEVEVEGYDHLIEYNPCLE